MANYEKTLATSKPYKRSSKLSREEQLATDLEEFRREKEFIHPGEAGTFSNRDLRGGWAVGTMLETPRDTLGDRAREEELGIKGWKPGATVDHKMGVVLQEQPNWPNLPGDQKKKKKRAWKGLRSVLLMKRWSW